MTPKWWGVRSGKTKQKGSRSQRDDKLRCGKKRYFFTSSHITRPRFFLVGSDPPIRGNITRTPFQLFRSI